MYITQTDPRATLYMSDNTVLHVYLEQFYIYSLYTASLWDYSRKKVGTKCLLHKQILELHCTCQILPYYMYIWNSYISTPCTRPVSGTTPGERLGPILYMYRSQNYLVHCSRYHFMYIYLKLFIYLILKLLYVYEIQCRFKRVSSV